MDLLAAEIARKRKISEDIRSNINVSSSGIIGIYYLIISTMNMSVANKKIKWFYYTLILLGVYTFIKHTYYLSKDKHLIYGIQNII